MGVWFWARPSSVNPQTFVGELLGAEAVLLLSIALILISTLPFVERWFDGIDRAAIWHRRVVIAAMILLLVHAEITAQSETGSLGLVLHVLALLGLGMLVVWAILPRLQAMMPKSTRGFIAKLYDTQFAQRVAKVFGGYDKWRSFHRFTGLFVAVGFIHGLMDGKAFGSPLLRYVYIVIGGVGLAFYAYRELLARRLAKTYDFQVDSVKDAGGGITEISLKPLDHNFTFTPGQFVLLNLEARDGWHRHPFTVSSAPYESLLRVAVKGLGDFTANIPKLVSKGMPAVISQPHGHFSHRRGTDHQLWIAAGAGIAPFLSWLRAADSYGLPEQVSLFYTAAGELPFREEILQIAQQHKGITVYFHDSNKLGRLTVERIFEQIDVVPKDLSVFMCGPVQLKKSFQAELQSRGVKPRNIHHEYFDWR
jgi:predicted ferric reductase